MSTVPASFSSAFTPPEEQRRLEELLAENMPAAILQARAAFHRDLPRLLQHHPRAWIAYGAAGSIAIGRSKTDLHQQCLRRGLTPDQFLIVRVEPQQANEVILPIDV